MRPCEIVWDLLLWNLVRSYKIISSMSPCANGTRTLAVVPEYKIPCLMGTEVHPVTLFKICWDLVRSCEIMWDLIIRDLVRSYDIIWDLNLWDLVRSYEIFLRFYPLKSCEILWDLILSVKVCQRYRTLAVILQYKIPYLMDTEVHPVTMLKICTWDLELSCEKLWDHVRSYHKRSCEILWDNMRS